MRKTQLFQKLDLVPLAFADAGRGPFAHAIDRQDRRALERRRKERRGRVGLVVLRENDRAFVAELVAQVRFEPDLFLHPDRHRF